MIANINMKLQTLKVKLRKMPFLDNNTVIYTMKRFIPTFIVVLVVFLLLYRDHSTIQENTNKQRAVNKIELQKNYLHNEFRFVVSDLLHLAEFTSMEISDGDTDELIKNYLTVIRNKKIYDRVSFLDLTGKEVVRVNYNDGDIQLVDMVNLQSKAKEAYFIEAQKLKAGEVYVGPYDLKFDYGKLVTPIKPIIRFLTPVYDHGGKKRGYVLISYLGENLIKELELLNSGDPEEFLLLNNDGYWLHSKDQKYEWGFVWDKRRNFKAYSPKDWTRIDTGETGQFYGEKGLYTYTKISPLKEVQSGLTQTPQGEHTTLDSLKDYRWIIISKLDIDILKKEKNNVILRFVLLFIFVNLIIFSLYLYLAKTNSIRRKAEEDRKKFDTELAKLDRLNMLGEVAAGIGHEIRNPMTTVRGFLQLIIEKNEGKDNQQAYNLMIQELDRANLIITEFLSLAKNKVVELKLANLNQIVEAILPLIQAEAVIEDKFVEIKLGVIPEIPLDEKELRQLLLNLALNGLDAMETRGCLKISTYQRGKEVYLEVADEGYGIPSDVMDKIGVPFFTTKDEGVGLGLAVCYSIAQRHNARINVTSSSSGTKFNVIFPIINN